MSSFGRFLNSIGGGGGPASTLVRRVARLAILCVVCFVLLAFLRARFVPTTERGDEQRSYVLKPEENIQTKPKVTKQGKETLQGFKDRSLGESIVVTDSNMIHMEADESVKEMRVFKPTKEWAVIPDGYAIPKGIHVKMNLETGMKEGKLLDDETEKGEQSLQAVPVKKTGTVGETGSEEVVEMSEEKKKRLEDIKKRFEQYKSERVTITDVESMSTIIKELILLHEKEGDQEKRKQSLLKIFTILEELIHQSDNAVDFTKMGGLQILSESLLDPDDVISAHAALVVGSAIQSNLPVKKAFMQLDGLTVLLSELAKGNNSQKKTKMFLFAVSCLIRNVPEFQEQFIVKGGLDILRRMVTSTVRESGVTINRAKLAAKALTLISDMLEEQIGEASYVLLENTSYGCPSDFPDCNQVTGSAKLSKFAGNIVLSNMVLEGWCDVIDWGRDLSTIKNDRFPILGFADHHFGIMETMIEFIELTTTGCGKYYNENGIMDGLKRLEEFLDKEFKNPSSELDSELVGGLIGKVKSITAALTKCGTGMDCVLPVPIQT
eukprot:Nk52_evm18s270 gene=Nk52_evmTU18s270